MNSKGTIPRVFGGNVDYSAAIGWKVHLYLRTCFREFLSTLAVTAPDKHMESTQNTIQHYRSSLLNSIATV